MWQSTHLLSALKNLPPLEVVKTGAFVFRDSLRFSFCRFLYEFTSAILALGNWTLLDNLISYKFNFHCDSYSIGQAQMLKELTW